MRQGGREGFEAEWEKTDEFHETWKLKARDMLARAEFRRRKLTKRVRHAVCVHAWVGALHVPSLVHLPPMAVTWESGSPLGSAISCLI